MEVFMKVTKWKLQDAKNKFSEVIRKASDEGPQVVTKHGKESVIVLSVQDFKKLKQSKTTLVEFFRNSPLATVKLDIDRDKSYSRKVSL